MDKSKRVFKQCAVCKVLISKEYYERGKCQKCLDKEAGIYVPKPKGKRAVEIFGGSVVIHAKDNTEEELLKSWAKDYKDIEFDIPDYYNDLSALLQYRLEAYRIGEELSDTDEAAERKRLHDSLNYSNNQIKATQEKLGITRDKIQKKKTSAEQMFPQYMREFAKFRAENQHVFRGIAICEKCNDRVVFKSFLPTFEQLSIIKLKEISPTCQTPQELIEKYEKWITDFGSPEIYSEEMRREIEKVTDEEQ